MRVIIKTLYCILLLTTYTSSFAGKAVDVVGTAKIEHGMKETARHNALLNAFNQAVMEAGVEVKSQSSGKFPMGSMQLRSKGSVNHYDVINEWVTKETNIFNIHIRANVSQNGKCGAAMISPYRKRIVAAQFLIKKPQHLSDLGDISINYPRELVREIAKNRGYSPIDATQYGVERGANGAILGEEEIRERVRHLAEKHAAQFVLSGTVIDGGGNEFSTGIGSNFFTPKRTIEIEIAIYDGLTGTLLTKQRQHDTTIPSLNIDQFISFASSRFEDKRAGKMVTRLLRTQAEAVRAYLACVPYATRIVEVSGDKIYLGNGSHDGIKVGDRLMSYRLAPVKIRGYNDSNLGLEEQQVSVLTITKTQPLFAIGKIELDPLMANLQAGDIVRSW